MKRQNIPWYFIILALERRKLLAWRDQVGCILRLSRLLVITRIEFEQQSNPNIISSSSLKGIIPREGLVSVLGAEPKRKKRVCGKRSKNSRNKILSGTRLSIAAVEITERKVK